MKRYIIFLLGPLLVIIFHNCTSTPVSVSNNVLVKNLINHPQSEVILAPNQNIGIDLRIIDKNIRQIEYWINGEMFSKIKKPPFFKVIPESLLTIGENNLKVIVYDRYGDSYYDSNKFLIADTGNILPKCQFLSEAIDTVFVAENKDFHLIYADSDSPNSELEVTFDNIKTRLYQKNNMDTIIYQWNGSLVNGKEGSYYIKAKVMDKQDGCAYSLKKILVRKRNIEENFDELAAFTENILPWNQLDRDYLVTAGLAGISFPGEQYTGAFIVFNPSLTNPPIDNHLKPYSGKQVLACFNVADTTKHNDDWLISPIFEVREHDKFTFMAKSGLSAYNKEKIEILISTEGSLDINNYIVLDCLDVEYEWTKYHFSLGSYIGKNIRVAIRCISKGGMILMLDDLKLGQ